MKEIVDKLVEIEKRTSAERGAYDLFALLLREDSSDKWDIIDSSTRIIKYKCKALKYLADNIQRILTQNELLLISRIVIIEETNSALPALQQAMRVEHGTAEVKESNFFGLQIKHAFLITSGRSQAA
ncbi:MAG: hypothetical protein LH606_18620 [Cytophagaceae bacterium]|nr:hypothetical protein [Cytophagaceae bacterium]